MILHLLYFGLQHDKTDKFAKYFFKQFAMKIMYKVSCLYHPVKKLQNVYFDSGIEKHF